MENVKYLVLGAGPAGLAFANRIKQRGENNFRVVEKEGAHLISVEDISLM